MLIEDCAQAYSGGDYRGHERADVSMFSFGPIKTATALGGGMLCIRDAWLRARVSGLQSRLPVQNRWSYLCRVCKYAAIKSILGRRTFSAFVAVARLLGKSHDEVISSSLRGFPGPKFFSMIRRQPCFPLLALLMRRLVRHDSAEIESRKAAAETAISLMEGVRRPGADSAYHTHWVFPMQSDTPDDLVRHLWRRGFDATRGASSLFVVPPAPDRPDTIPREALSAMDQVVYLPVYPGVSASQMQSLAAAIAEHDRAHIPSNVEACRHPMFADVHA